MNSKKRESPPSSEGSGKSQKRQKPDITGDPPVPNVPAFDLQLKVITYSNKLSSRAAAKARLKEIKSARENLDEEERKIFEDEAKVLRSANNNLKAKVTNFKQSFETTRTALEAAKAELSQVTIEKDKEIKELKEKAKRNSETLEAAKKRIIELRQNAKSESSCQERMKQLKEAKEKILKLEAELKSLWEELQELLPEAARAKELDKKLQLLTEVPPKAVQLVTPSCKTSDVAGKTEQQVAPVQWKALHPVNPQSHSKDPKNVLTLANSKVNSLEEQSKNCQQKLPSSQLNSELNSHLPKSKIDNTRDQLENPKKDSCHVPESEVCRPQKEKKESQQKCEVLKAEEREMAKRNTELDPKMSKSETSVPVIEEGSLVGVNGSSCPKTGDDENAQQNLLIPVGKFSVLASDSRFVHMDWSKHCQPFNYNQFQCTICGMRKISRLMVEEHIWVTHYGGRFKCPRCPDSSVTFPSRNDIRIHAALVHPKWIME